ncbi:MAG TPA: hypothetical protein VHM28_01740 [Anaerolineales bacterium]|nr:hypothetical protein [Anaerolineales bacterium]
MKKTARGLLRYTFLWSILLVAVALGAARYYILNGQINSEHKTLLNIAVALALLGGLLWLIIHIWGWIEQKGNAPGGQFLLQRGAIPASFLLITQATVFALAIVIWLNLESPASSSLNKFPLWFWTFVTSFLTFAIYTISQLGSYRWNSPTAKWATIRETGIFICASVTSIFIGLAATNLLMVYGILSSSLIIYLLDIGLPFFVLDLNLLPYSMGWAKIKRGLSFHTIDQSLSRIKNSAQAWRSNHLPVSPWTLSLSTTAIFFLIHLGILRPRYGTNDDVDMISVVAGYLGGKPFPFLTYSNVLLGLILKPLYSLHFGANWMILLFIGVNILSIWAFIYIIVSRFKDNSHKALGIAIVLICDSDVILNITFSSIALIACLAGACLLLTSAQKPSVGKNHLSVYGIVLILLGSLIRIEAISLIPALILPVTVLLHNSFDKKRLLYAFATGCIIISGFYAFDRLYLLSSPDWYAYNIYNNTRSMLHDTPRLQMLHTAFRQIGWSANDTILFTQWFFPDKNVYSLANLQYLVKNISDTNPSLLASIKSVFGYLFNVQSTICYLLLIGMVWLWTLFHKFSKGTMVSLVLVMICFLATNIYLDWGYHSAPHVLIPTLESSAIISFLILDWSKHSDTESECWFSTKQAMLGNLGSNSFFSALIVTIGMVSFQAITTTQVNINTQNGYKQVMSDLVSLQTEGKIPKKVLIVSTANGIPLEWSNPMTLDFPKVQILQMGTFTFSPPYEQVMRNFEIRSLTDSLYQTNYVFVLGRDNSMKRLVRYIKEHDGILVNAQKIYEVTYDFDLSKFKDIGLYKLEETK